ncbi:hypothetical protein [Mesorhizobium sp. B2-3-12]|uniref:hypothetical protein n=1 Tax=Mesorhizobium sp. B2-3-12 TaxID=2589952 RepID=UPI001AED46D8|nr:hypothetical protein [Mesorhizobium sp. B2-3-12]
MRAGYRRSSIARHLWKTTALTSLALALSGAAAYGDDAGLWQPQIRAIVGADNNGGNAALEGFIPIKQTAESVLFLDVRAKHDFKDAFGQDIGLGIRRIVNPDLMLGGYAYFNAESYGGTQFTGGTLGVEAITPNFDAHVNVFIPIKGDSTDHSASSTLSMVSNQLIEQISVLDHRDYAAWGIEGEVGAKVPINLPDKHSLRLDIGGYHFEDPHGDDGSVTGAKAGIEYEIGDVFGTGTSLTFTGEVRNDNRDDTQFAGSVRLNIPFNPGGGSDNTAAIGADPVFPVSEGLRKRVNERVRGDVGVRIQSQELTGGSTTRVAINAATNAAFGKFYFADGGLAGAGTQADPTTLDDAVTKAGNGGFIVALGGSGNITTDGVTLATGQTVIGGGENVTAKLFNGSTATFNLGGSDGTIQGTNVANPVITLGTGNTLNGITITGGADGIFGNNVTNTTLTKVTVTGAGGNGAEFTGNSTNVKASDFTSTNNGLDGLHIEDNGTYNFTGTTLLSGNLDDGLDITGQGTYTFATVNALNNTDRGITVQGTSSGGSFTTTGGNISGNGGIGVYIDPITAHVVLDSISQAGGTSGVVLDHVSGSFTVNGATTISNTTGPAIAISDSPAVIRFGDISIATPGGDGMVFSGVNAAVVAGNIVVSGLGLGHTGLDFSGSQTTFTALSANISGSGAGSIGIDLSDTTGGASIIITNGGTISGVDTGVRLGVAGSLAHSANAQFTFGGGSIAGVTASLDARGLNQTLGLYAFGSTTFSGPQLFDVQNVIFVGAAASGAGDGSSLGNLASVGTADGITDANAIFVLVNDAGNTPIDTTGGFSLSDDQTLASFGNGRSFSLGGVPINVTGDNIQHDVVVSDPGTGAATLTNSGAGDVVTLGNGNSLLDFNISGGSGAAISGAGIAGLTVQGVSVSNVALGLVLDSVTGAVTVDDLDIQNVSQTGIALADSSATVNFTGNTTIANATNVGLFANNFDGTATFDDLDITGGGIGVGVVGGSSGTLTFGAGSSIAGTGGNAFSITSSTPNVTYNGTINQTSAASAVKISNMTGGSAIFGGKITASTGAANAIDLTGNTGGTINFTGGLDLTTDGGYAFSAVNGGTLTVTGSGNTVNTGAGVTENGIHLGGAGGLTIGAAGVTFASVTVDGSGGSVPAGIVIENTSGGNVTFGGVDISRANGDAIRLTNVASGIYSFNGTTTIATVGGPGPGFVVQNSAATVNVSNLVTTSVSGADVSLTNNTGTIGIGGTITNSGTGDGVVVSGGSAAITVSAAISSSATAPGTAVKVDGITGGSVTFSGNVTSTGTGNLFAIGSTTAPTGGAISFTGSALTASGGGGAVIAGLGAAATFNATAPLSITNAIGNGLSVSNVAGSATFGAVTVTTAGGNGIDISGNSGSVTFGTTNVTLGSAGSTAGINFSGTNADVSFGTTTVTMGAGANQAGIDFSGSSTTADFGVTTITGNGDLTSRGIDLSSTTGNKTITFLAGSSISNAGVGVELASDHSTATSANANFTFGDGTSANGLQSSITAAAGGYTVNTVGLDPALGNYNFNDVFFTGSANLALAAGGVIMVSQTGGVINAGTDGLSANVATVTAAEADAMTGTLSFAFVGTVDLSGTPFTLDAGQSIVGFGNGSSIVTSGTIQPVNVQGNLGATGATVTGNEGVVMSTGSDTLHLLGGNQVKDTAFDFSGGSGSVFTIDSSAATFDNTGGIVINGVTVSNVAVGQTAFKVDGATGTIGNVSITNNNINVAGTLLDANGGNGDITVTRGTLPNSGPAGTLTGGGITIANRTGGTVDFTDHVTVDGNGVSLTNNTGAAITFADVDITTNGSTAFTATGGGTIKVDAGTINATNAQAAALDGVTADIHFTSTSATFGGGNGIDLQNLGGTADFGTGTLTNTGSDTSFNVGSTTAASGGTAAMSYSGTIATNGTGAAVSIQSMTAGSVTLSGNLTDNNAAAGGNIFVAGNDSTTITFSGTTKQISSGAADGVNLGLPGGWPLGTPTPNTNSAINFTNGGLDITTTTGAGFIAIGDLGSSTFTVIGSGNKINSGGDGLLVNGADVGAGGVTFDSISAVSTSANGGGAGVFLSGMTLAGDVNIGGLTDTGYIGASLSGLFGTGVVNFTGTTDLDTSYEGFEISGQVGTINIANVAGSTLTIDGSQVGLALAVLQTGTVNVGGNGGVASIGATTSTTGSAISLSGGNDLINATLNYNGSIKVDTGSVLQASGDWTHLTMRGSVVSTTASTAFDFFGHADGIYDISSTIDHSGGTGVSIGGSANGTVTFSGTSKMFDTGANDAIYKAPAYVPDPQSQGTLNFTNGGLVITTTSGAGFTASTFGPGTVSVTGDGNTITTGTGTALKLGDATAIVAGATGATVGVDGIKFDSISATGAATGISLNNVSGGALDLGTVNLQGITGAGVQISGALGSTLDFTSLNVGLAADNAIGLDLNGAALGASTITAGDFDVDGGSFAGTIGIDMAGTTGTGTIQLGDLVNSNPAGQTSKIENVGYGVQFSSATNAKLVFGDGQGPAESTIATTGGQVIHATDSLPTNGDYNFNDVIFSGDTSNLSSSISYYYVDNTVDGTDDGTRAHPGTIAGALASSAQVIVLVNNGGTITGGTTLTLADGQALVGFRDGGTVDLATLGFTAGGAPSAFQFTTITAGGTTVTDPTGNGAVTLTTMAAEATVTLTGTNGISGVVIGNGGGGAGIIGTNIAGLTLLNSTVRGGIGVPAVSITSNTVTNLALSNLTLKSGTGAAALSIDGTGGTTTITRFDGLTIEGGAGSGSGIAINTATFDATPGGAINPVNGGNSTVGTAAARVNGNGISLTQVSGELDYGTLNIANDGGTGLLVDTKGPPATIFTLNSSGGSVDTTNGTALNLDPLTVGMTLDSVTATGGASGIIFDGVAGAFTVTGATSISGTSGAGISAINTNAGTFTFNTVTVDNTSSTGGGIGWASGTLTVSGLADINTTSGAGLSQTGGTTSFTGGLTLDTTSGDGFFVTTGAAVTVTGATNTVTTATGRIVSMQTATIGAGGVTFDALTATGTVSGGPGVQISGVSGGAFNGGDVSIAGSSNNAITVQNSTSSTVNFDSAVVSGATLNGIDINGGVTGTVTFGTVTINNTGASGVRLLNTSGTVNINGGSIGATNDPTGIGVEVSNGAATLNIAASVTKTSAGKIVDISGVTGGTVTLSGKVSATGGFDNGISVTGNSGGTFNFSGANNTLTTGANAAVNLATSTGATTNFGGGGLAITTTSGAGFSATTGGTVSVTGAGNTISTGTGTALTLTGVTAGAGGVNFNTVSTTNAATGISLANVASSGGGAIALGTVNLQGITSVGVDVAAVLNAALSFNSLAIGLNSSTATAFDLSGATINAAITANDFDVTNAAAGAGTSIGVNLSGATGGQTVRLGDAVVGGNSSSIAGVNTGVLLNTATNLGFIFGDGESATDQNSTISANVGIDASNAPTLGTYNFKDVTFQASPGKGFGIGKIYFVGASATGNGSGNDQNNLTTLTGAEFQAGPNDIIVLVNNGVITAAGGDNSLTLLAGEQVRGFGNGNINLALTVPSTIQLASNNVSIADQTGGGAATLTSTDGSSIIKLGLTGNNIIDGFIIDGDDGAGLNAGIGISGSGTANATISNMTIRNVTAANIDFGTNAAGTTTLTNLSLITSSTATGIKFGAASGTVNATNVDTTGGSGLSVIGGNAAFNFDSASSVTSVTGTAVSITNRSGGSFGFAGAVTSGVGGSGIAISGATAANTVSFTGAVTHNNSTGTAVSINNGGQASTVSFANLVIATGGSNTAFTATNGGTVNVTTGSINATAAQAINLNGIAAGINFTSTSSGGGANNVSLANVSGTVSLGTGALSGASGNAFNVSGGNATISYGGTIAKTSAGNVVSVSSHTGGTTTFSGAISATSSSGGIALSNNTGAIINFTNTLTLTGSNVAGFSATGGGTISANGTGSIISSGTATALNVTGTTIGGAGMTFRSISSNGAANGIVLNNTGTAGGLTVTGDGGGANNGSGGIIQNSTGDGISLTNTQDVHLAYMNLTNNLGDGIGGSGINGFVLNRLNISGNGSDAATDESGINITQLTGTASNGAHATSISNSVISNNNEFEIQISNSSGTLTNLVFNNNTISSNGLPINGNASSQHGNLVNFLGTGSSTMGITVTGGSFTGNWNAASPPATITGTGLFANSGGTSMTVNVSGATFTNNNAGVDVSTDPVSTSLTFDIENNTFIGSRSTAINHFDNGNGPFTRTVNGTIKNNTIGDNAVTNSGALLGNGITIQNEGAINGKYLIDGNKIYQIATAPGISVNVGLGGLATGGGETDVTITNNTFDHMNGSRAITIQDNQDASFGPFPTIWANVQGNSFANVAGQAGNGQFMRIRQLAGTVKVTQGAATAGNTATELDNANGSIDPTKFNISGTVTFSAGIAPLPTTNPLP